MGVRSGGNTDVRWCPACGGDLNDPQGFVAEYWKAKDRWFLTWCSRCHTTAQVCLPHRITATEPEH